MGAAPAGADCRILDGSAKAAFDTAANDSVASNRDGRIDNSGSSVDILDAEIKGSIATDCNRRITNKRGGKIQVDHAPVYTTSATGREARTLDSGEGVIIINVKGIGTPSNVNSRIQDSGGRINVVESVATAAAAGSNRHIGHSGGFIYPTG